MEKIFSLKYTGTPFSDFSMIHLNTLLFLVITNFLIIFIFKKTNNFEKKNLFRYFTALIMLFYTASFEVWTVSVGSFTVKYSLPLHLCDVATILAAIMLLTKNRYIFEITYFWGLGGSLLAILTPDITESFPHFVFINYFLSHGGIITCVLFMVFIEKYKVTLKSVIRVFIITNLYMFLIAGVNIILKSNYLYICRKPNNPSLIDLLGPWPWYILNLEIVSLIIFLILYLPFAFNGYKGKTKTINFSA